MSYATTKAGEALWVNAFVPDFKFDENGVYNMKFRLRGEEAMELQETVDNHHSNSKARAKEENPKKKIKEASLPYTEVFDEDGNETGELEFTFKQKAVITTKKGPMDMSVAVFDAKGSPITKPVSIGNGSEVIVAYEPYLYYVGSMGAGVTLRFKGLQILKLVAPPTKDGDEADSYGFKKQEEGYESKEESSDDHYEDEEDQSPFKDETKGNDAEEEDF